MKETMRRWQGSAMAAHAVPLVVFVLFTAVPGWFRIDNAALPWYQQGPEHWVYPIQTLICAGLLLFWRQHYTLSPWRGLVLAVLLGVVGIALWIAPGYLHFLWRDQNVVWPSWWEWLGWSDRYEGFDPGLLKEHPVGQQASISMRFVRMVIVVPLVEEIFWRGFLMRYVVAEMRGADWRAIPFGTHHRVSFWVTTLGVTAIHNTADWPAAFIWGALMYGLAVRTKSLGACVVMHAVGNLILGIYVLQTQQWGFW